jgi:hypothetical protein
MGRIHHELDRLEQDCGSNANKQQLAGINTIGQIIKTLVPPGFNRKHLAVTPTNRKVGWPRRDADRIISLVAD